MPDWKVASNLSDDLYDICKMKERWSADFRIDFEIIQKIIQRMKLFLSSKF